MALVLLGRSNWGYHKPGTHIGLVPQLLRLFFETGGSIRNFNIYSVEESIDLRRQDILDENKLQEVINYVDTNYRKPAHSGASFGGFFELSEGKIRLLNFAIQKPYLWLGAEDCISEFLSKKGSSAIDNVSRLVELAISVASSAEVKELVGDFAGRVTFFIGEPALLYRPALLKRFAKGYGYDDAVDEFWRMHETVTNNLPREEILELVRASSVDFRTLNNGKILARFCRALDDVEVSGEEIFLDVGRLVDRALEEKRIPKTWR
jgi:hypothetical protein